MPTSIDRLTSITSLNVRFVSLNFQLIDNRIATLPRELFNLNKLKGLYVRIFQSIELQLAGNNIQIIPPEIKSLTALRELGVRILSFHPSQ